MNYCQERLQMLFHDSTFTSEQDRYIQENINWVFSELATSPLAVIDTIDKHVPQVGGEAGREAGRESGREAGRRGGGGQGSTSHWLVAMVP